MAVRHVSGEIVLESWPTAGGHKPKVLRAPFIRGIFNFIDSLRYGYKCLMRSAELSGLEDEEEPPKGKRINRSRRPARSPYPPPRTRRALWNGSRRWSSPPKWHRRIPPRPAVCGGCRERGGDRGRGGRAGCSRRPAGGESCQGGKQGREGAHDLPDGAQLHSGCGPGHRAVFVAAVLFVYASQGAVPALDSSALRGVFEGVFRILLFIGYMLLCP